MFDCLFLVCFLILLKYIFEGDFQSISGLFFFQEIGTTEEIPYQKVQKFPFAYWPTIKTFVLCSYVFRILGLLCLISRSFSRNKCNSSHFWHNFKVIFGPFLSTFCSFLFPLNHFYPIFDQFLFIFDHFSSIFRPF